MCETASYSQCFADASVANVHVAKRQFPFLETTERFLLLMPQQPDELFFVTFAETFVQL